MSALERLVERLDARIKKLRKTKRVLTRLGIQDQKLDKMINRLVSMRSRLKGRSPQEGDLGDPKDK